MRVLITFVGGFGHLAPLLPVARAARALGHDVAIAGSGGLVGRIEEAGFRGYPTSPRPHHSGTAVTRDLTPLQPTDARAAEVEFAANFASRGARRMAGAVPAVLEDFRPDLVIRDETDLGTTIAAELHDIPVATHLVLASGLLVRPELVGPELDSVRSEHGLAPDPGLARLTSGPVLSAFPPGLRSPEAPVALSPVHYRRVDGPPRSAVRARARRPRVYATLGTIFNKTSGDLLERMAAGLAGLDADALLTVGRDIDPRDLGAQPDHVRIEGFVPQEDVLSGTDVVVHHGGSGVLLDALRHGLPSVVLPLGADQSHNARRAGELGLARTLDAATVTPRELAHQVEESLADTDLRGRCEQVAAQVEGLPDVDAVVAELLATSV